MWYIGRHSPSLCILNAFPALHRREQHSELPAAARDEARDLGALGQRQADVIDRDILDLVDAFTEPEPPTDRDRSTLPRDDLANHDDAVGASPAVGYDEISVAGLCELSAIETNEPIREMIAELAPLLRARNAPVGTENEAADACQIEIPVDHLAEIVRFVAERHVGTDHRDRLLAEGADKPDRRFVRRGGAAHHRGAHKHHWCESQAHCEPCKGSARDGFHCSFELYGARRVALRSAEP